MMYSKGGDDPVRDFELFLLYVNHLWISNGVEF